MDPPFTMAELLFALQDSKVNSIPDPDRVTYAVFQNLPGDYKLQLLDIP